MQINRIFAAALCIAAAQFTGCGRDATAPTQTSPTTAPSASAVPAATTRPAAVLNIGGKPTQFPSAKLVLTKKPGGINAMLCSDDPPNAIESNYAGNSFMLDMKLDIEDPQEIESAVWMFKAPDREPQDSTNGIFLNGARRQMQPADVKITFEKHGDQVVASLSGQFLLLDSHDVTAPSQPVDVSGQLNAVVLEQ
jgi:hypothetical protein